MFWRLSCWQLLIMLCLCIWRLSLENYWACHVCVFEGWALGTFWTCCIYVFTSPLSHAKCHEIWEPKPPGTIWATLGLLRDSTFFIHCDYLNVSCCLSHVHTSVWIIVMNALRLPTEHGGHCRSLATVPRTARDSTRKGCCCWCCCGSYHRNP